MMVAGAKLAAIDSPLFDALPASDAPVANVPGHRRDKILTPNHAFVAVSAPATAVSLSVVISGGLPYGKPSSAPLANRGVV
jgi:hypothetical protein